MLDLSFISLLLYSKQSLSSTADAKSCLKQQLGARVNIVVALYKKIIINRLIEADIINELNDALALLRDEKDAIPSVGLAVNIANEQQRHINGI